MCLWFFSWSARHNERRLASGLHVWGCLSSRLWCFPFWAFQPCITRFQQPSSIVPVVLRERNNRFPGEPWEKDVWGMFACGASLGSFVLSRCVTVWSSYESGLALHFSGGRGIFGAVNSGGSRQYATLSGGEWAYEGKCCICAQFINPYIHLIFQLVRVIIGIEVV